MARQKTTELISLKISDGLRKPSIDYYRLPARHPGSGIRVATAAKSTVSVGLQRATHTRPGKVGAASNIQGGYT
ncbi:hypothetical protein MES5069_400118 [Mesorhizobium escarrei]|uniref:Uncharacterized protein n=1 Tax=Mesorhizobium escarrei TaxID=666018 RepID=A0ABM9E4S3_9HYPH|nr:hypothetical protein MES5069_400118 [Mesorhizobium escarrei]